MMHQLQPGYATYLLYSTYLTYLSIYLALSLSDHLRAG